MLLDVIAAVAFVSVVVVGTLALQPPKARHGAWRGRGAPQRPSPVSSATGTLTEPHRPPTAPHAPSWAHTQPNTHKEAA